MSYSTKPDAVRQRLRRQTDPAWAAMRNELNLAQARNNPGKATARVVARKAMKLQRTPKWADLEKIKQVYIEASILGMEVDHIVPLKGKLVSGLHVHTNLQILDSITNRKKWNFYEVQ